MATVLAKRVERQGPGSRPRNHMRKPVRELQTHPLARDTPEEQNQNTHVLHLRTLAGTHARTRARTYVHTHVGPRTHMELAPRPTVL